MQKFMDVMGKKYGVKILHPEIVDRISRLSGTAGLTIHWKQLILIAKDLGKEAVMETLLHETIHAVDKEMDLGMKEGQVRRLSVGLYQVFRHNEKIWKKIWRNK